RRPRRGGAGPRGGWRLGGPPRWWRSSCPAVWRCAGRRARTLGSAWRSAPPRTAPSAATPSPVWRDVPVVGDPVAAADGGGEPGPGRQLARRGEPADVAGPGEDDQRGERADARQLGEHLD